MAACSRARRPSRQAKRCRTRQCRRLLGRHRAEPADQRQRSRQRNRAAGYPRDRTKDGARRAGTAQAIVHGLAWYRRQADAERTSASAAPSRVRLQQLGRSETKAVGILRGQGTRSIPIFRFCAWKSGAGSGNRTRIFSLEGCCSTTELYPPRVSGLPGRQWWRGLDSNQRRLSQRIYSPSPLTTRAPLQSATGAMQRGTPTGSKTTSSSPKSAKGLMAARSVGVNRAAGVFRSCSASAATGHILSKTTRL